jgi:hypothetical protein
MLFIRRLYGVLLIFLILCLTGCSAGQDANLPANDSSVTELKTETTKAGEKAEPAANFDTRFTVLCDRILTDRQKESVDMIIDELNILSRNALGITVEFVFTDPNKRYSDFLKLLIDSGDAPDIFQANGLYGSDVIIDNLYKLVQNEVIADLTDLIYHHAPYTYAFYHSYPAFKEFSMIDGRIYGIMMSEFSLPMLPILLVKKELCEKYDLQSITTYYEALDVCMDLTSDIEGDDKKIFVESSLCMQMIVDHEGYYNVLSPPYTYLLKKDDPDLILYRIDKTDILNAVIIMKEDFEKRGIRTYQLIPDFQEFNACLTSIIPDVNPEDYKIFHLINNTSNFDYDMQLSSFRYFVVSNRCTEKEKAVAFIDWLFEKTEARKLVAFGMEDVHYSFDNQKNVITRTDDTVFLFPIGTGDSFAWVENQFVKDKNEINYLKEIKYKNLVLNELSKKMLQNLSKIEIHNEKLAEARLKYQGQYKYETRDYYNDLFPSARDRYTVAQYMHPNISIDNVIKAKEIFSESYYQEFHNVR